MRYLNDETVNSLNLNWDNNIQVIADAVQCISLQDTVQPIKPYLRYGDPGNRIIAMPAFIGGTINKSGIKWIASFPDNINKGLARAHSVTILNDADTGVPIGIVNSGSLSAIRTASVSGFILKQFVQQRKPERLKVGIVGFGPIGQHHLNMCHAVLGDSIEEISVYDLLPVKEELIHDAIREKVTIAESWEQAYANADVFITCTVSKERYIDKKPKAGSLHLNVSLRDYKPEVFSSFQKGIIVDNWEEICRENTDIEIFHKTNGLQKKDVKEIQYLLTKDCFSFLDNNEPIMFNPMGMAIFDIAMADRFLKLAREADAGLLLEVLNLVSN
jgi:N-[(2S)-2-amino-2-carboxyethyl]-L-glutamate dehydrogenase